METKKLATKKIINKMERENDLKINPFLPISELHCVAEDLQLGNLLCGRYYMLADIEKDSLWTAWDLRRKRQIAIKTKMIMDDGEMKPIVWNNLRIGEVIKGRYYLLQNMSGGMSASIWLSWDFERQCEVILKLSHGIHGFDTMLENEADLLKDIHQRQPWNVQRQRIIGIIDAFPLNIMHRHSYCIVLELKDRSLLDFMRLSANRLPLNVAKQISRKILEGMDYLHNGCSVIHTDLKPENILISENPDSNELDVHITDFGLSVEATAITGQISTRYYRAPEVILGTVCYGNEVDIWSIGCLIYELITGEILFNVGDHEKNADQKHIHEMIALLGNIPHSLLCRATIEDIGQHQHQVTGDATINIANRMVVAKGWDQEEALLFASFLKPMLEYLGKERPTAAECLSHPWLNY